MVLEETVSGVDRVRTASRFVIVFDLTLYFSVRTRESFAGSDTVFTQRGKANWSFDGSGDIVWQYDQVLGAQIGVWQPGLAGNSGDAAFSEITSGVVVPLSTPITTDTKFLNDELMKQVPLTNNSMWETRG